MRDEAKLGMAAAKTSLHNFDLWIEPGEFAGESGYRARASCGNREERSEFQLVFSDSELAQLHESTSQDTREIGGRLFRAAFSNEILALFRHCRETKADSLRLILHLKAGSEPARWPWEFLWDDRGEGFLALSSSVVRWQEAPQFQPRPVFTPPLRLLVAMAQPRGLPPLFSEEPAWIERILDGCTDRVEIEVLRSATFDGVERRLTGPNPYHVFHFLGHGSFEAHGTGALLFETDQGRVDLVDSLRLSSTLRNCTSLRLVVLNACEGALAVTGDPLSGLAQALVHQGIPRVIAVQGKIFDRAAARFSEGFYGALAAGDSVESAMTIARSKMNTAPQGRNWGLPVLLTCVPDETLLPKPPPRWLRRLKLAAVLALLAASLGLYLLSLRYPANPPRGRHRVDCIERSGGQIAKLGGWYQGRDWLLERETIHRGIERRHWIFYLNLEGNPEIVATEDGMLRTKMDKNKDNNLDHLPACSATLPRRLVG
jgi:hypothetical protein